VWSKSFLDTGVGNLISALKTMRFNGEDIKAAIQYHIIFRNIIYIYIYIHNICTFQAMSIVFYAKTERKEVWPET